MEKIYGMHKLVGLQLFGSGTPTFSIGTPTFCQMGVLNSCFQNPSESSDCKQLTVKTAWKKFKELPPISLTKPVALCTALASEVPCSMPVKLGF